MNDELKKALIGALSSPNSDLTKSLRNENGAHSPGEDIARQILAKAGIANSDEIAKAISTGTGLIAYDLQAPAKNLYPVNTPLIKSLPRVGGGTGTATNWRQVNGIIGSGWAYTGVVPEGQRAGQMSYSTSNKSASYTTIGEEDQVTWEARSAAQGFEDVQASMTERLLQQMMMKEEMLMLGGNATLALGTPATPTLAATGSGGTLPGAPTTYSVIVVALTMEGFKNSSLAAGVATTRTITGADGKTFTLNGGSSLPSAAQTQAITLGQKLTCTVTAIQGAVAYAWFVGLSGAEKLEAITTINSVVFSAPLAGTHQAATAVTADCSLNANSIDGLLTTAFKSGSGAYVKQLATGTAGVGTVLTASGKGSVVEIDTMLQNLWDSYQAGVSVLWVNSQQLNDITTKCLSNGSAPLLQYFKDPASGEVRLTAGATIDFYFNPFLNGGQRIPVKIHPFVPPGTILGYAADLPMQYKSSNVPNVAEIKTRRDYYQISWADTTRASMVGVYAEETLAVYAPFAMASICNIAPG